MSSLAVPRPTDRHGAVVVAGLIGSLLIAASAVLSPILTIGAAVAGSLVVLTVTNLTYGLAVFTLLTFFERLPGLEGTSTTKLVGIVLVLAWLVALGRRAPTRLPLLPRDRPALAYLLILLVAWAGVTALWAVDPATTVSTAIRLALVVVLLFIVYTALRSRRDLLVITWSFLAGACIVSIYAVTTGSNKAGRLASGELDPNFLAATLVAAFSVAMFLFWGSARMFHRLVLIGFMTTYVVAIILTESRGGLVAGVVALVAAAVFGGPIRSRIIASIAVVAAIGIAYVSIAASSSFIERVQETNEGPRRELRFQSYDLATEIAKDNPFLGVGLGNFPLVQISYLSTGIDLPSAVKIRETRIVSHNTYLELLAELGLVGLALFTAALALTIGSAVSAIRKARTPAGDAALIARGFVVGTTALLVAYGLLSALHAKHLWLLLGIVAAIPTVLRTPADDELPSSAVARHRWRPPIAPCRHTDGATTGLPAASL